MKRLVFSDPSFDADLTALLESRQNPAAKDNVESVVRTIVHDVRTQGDHALLRYTTQLDNYPAASLKELVVSDTERKEAMSRAGPQIEADLRRAAERIELFHARQQEQSWSIETEDGVALSHRCVPLQSVGVYVPGGTAAYPSSVLMNVIPARVAGVQNIIMVTPAPGGIVNPAVLAAAEIAGVDKIVRIGGAQAIAALAFGTKTVPRVDKIVGPGNQWVAAAKRMVFGAVDIDMIAGPSELCVVATADGGASAEWLAADLLSQAEHDPKAMVSLITPDSDLATAVTHEIQTQLAHLPRQATAAAALRDYGLVILTDTLDQALTVADQMAPEHLSLVIPSAENHSERIRNAGAIFVGPDTPEAIGDYVAGPNHVLPTSGTARFFSPLGVYDFVKRINVIRFSKAGLRSVGPIAVRLARVEGLEAHALSVERRLKELETL